MQESFDGTRKTSIYKKLLPYLVLVLSLAFTVLAWQFYKTTAQQRVERRYNELVNRTVQEIAERLYLYETLLVGVAGVFAASEEVTRAEWQAYFEHQYFSGVLYPGSQEIAFARVIWPLELAQHIAEIRAEGFPGYTVWPAGDREVYTPAVFVTPFDERGRRAFGFDLFSEPTRRAAMEQARDTGAITSTAMLTLVTETVGESQPGFLMIVPIYARGMPLNNPEDRRAAIAGYVFSKLRVHDLMQHIFPDPLDNINFRIYDGAEASPETLIYDHHRFHGAPDEERTPLFASQIIMDLYGHHWTLAFQTTPAFEALETAVDRYTASGILAAGVLLSFVVFFSLRLLESTGDQALGLARKMTSALRESEQKYRFLTENISDVIWTTDLEGRLTYIGLANERMTGFTPEELMGMPMHDYVIPEDYAIVMEIVAEELAKPPAERSSSMIIPIRLKTKDNRLVHAELSAAWLLDEQGNTIGFQGSTRDITERKQAEQERAISLYTRNLIEVNLDPIVTISADGKITDVNKAAEEITGVSRTELIGSDFSGYFTEPEKAQEGYELAFRQGRVRDYPLTIHHSSGRNTDVLYNASVYRDETGEVQGVFAAARDMTESKMAKKMRERLRQVQALRNIDTTITGSLDLGVTFQVILDEITGMLNIDAVAILTLDSYTNTLKYDTWRGFSTKNLKNISLPLSEGYISRAVMEHQSIYIPDLRAAEPDPIQGSLNDKEGFVAHYAVPLIAKGTVRGLLQIFNRAPFEPDEEWFSFLETMAGQAAIAIDNAELFHRLERSNVGLLRAYDATIAGWAFALDLKDDETGEHSRRVTEMTLSIAREMGMESEQLAHIQRGALLHDIGKMGIPDKILLKPGPLTDNEWEIMRKHPRHAYNMLLPIDYLRPAMEIPYCHHEKFDGSGYPRGLKGEQIPLAARIFAVVDVFDALTSERPYRAAWSKEGALDYIKQQSSKHFDPQVVAVFLDMINNTD